MPIHSSLLLSSDLTPFYENHTCAIPSYDFFLSHTCQTSEASRRKTIRTCVMGIPQQHDEEPQTPLMTPHGDEGTIVLPGDNANPRETEDGATTMCEAPQYFAPPAHLAARFYRNRASARRKSSATSSRRNSLSSVHSHTSSISHRRSTSVGCQSNYIAQHLRRASIIESRKARLADRAAHAEQVRLRAALAKATPRGSISNSEVPCESRGNMCGRGGSCEAHCGGGEGKKVSGGSACSSGDGRETCRG